MGTYISSVPARFDVSGIAASGKLSAPEKKIVDAVLDRLRELNSLIERYRPANQAEQRRLRDEARRIAGENPTPANIHEFQRLEGYVRMPDAIFKPVHDDLNHLADLEARKLAPVASRLHSEALEAIADPERFGLAEINAKDDPDERAVDLIAHAAAHKTTIATFQQEAAQRFEEGRTALAWLTRHGYCPDIYAA